MRLHCCPPFRISKYEWGRELDLQRRVSVMLDYVYIIIFIQKWLIWGGMKQNNDPKLTFLRRTIPWSFGKIIIDICWCAIEKQHYTGHCLVYMLCWPSITLQTCINFTSTLFWLFNFGLCHSLNKKVFMPKMLTKCTMDIKMKIWSSLW